MTDDEDFTNHPDLGELEAQRTGEGEAGVTEHVATCDVCQRRLAELVVLAHLLGTNPQSLPQIPELMDQRIRRAAREAASRVRRERRRRTVQRWAIAATLLISVGALLVRRQMNSGSTGPVAPLDIVDALAAARQVAAAQPADQRYDVNHDGRVDDADVERIARQAVALGDA